MQFAKYYDGARVFGISFRFLGLSFEKSAERSDGPRAGRVEP